MTDLAVPDLADVLAARDRIAPYLRPTPLYRYPALDELTGARLRVKHENHQPVGAFKVRGGVNLVSQLGAAERAKGVITASTGNHGQSVAYAANLFGVRAIVCVPEQANPVKVESMRALGAEVVFHGRDFDEAREHCEKQAAEHGYRYIHSGQRARADRRRGHVHPGDPRGAAGHRGDHRARSAAAAEPPAPASWPRRSGRRSRSSACSPRRPRPRYRSWQAGALVEDTTSTFAEGLATRTAFELPQRILRERLDDFVLVSDDALRNATRVMIEKTRNLVEPAGAAALAAVLADPARFAGRKVAVVCSGGNISPAQLVALWPDAPAS